MKKYFLLALAILPAFSVAHPGHESISVSQGVWAGMLHPLMGLDHLLALLAFGVLLYKLSVRQSVAMGGSFITLMAIGFYSAQLGVMHLQSSTVESLILLSVGLSGILVVLHKMLNVQLSILVILAFAIFHGMAHGVEVPLTASAHGFAMGFALSCALVFIASRVVLTLLSRYTLSHKPVA